MDTTIMGYIGIIGLSICIPIIPGVPCKQANHQAAHMSPGFRG